MPEPKKRVYAADARNTIQVHLAAKSAAAAKQPADSPHNGVDRSQDEQRQAVINRLIDFFKGL